MRIFITGGTGFIGRYTIEELKKRGHRILALSRKNHKEKGVEYISGNLSEISKWEGHLRKFKPEVAIHLAWEGIPDFSYAQSVKNLKDGLDLFPVLMEAGCKKIVAAGTGFECGSKTGKILEDIPVAPIGFFTTAKHTLHLLGAELAKEKGIDFIWLRPFNPYGHGQRSGSLIPYIISCVANKTPLTLKKPLAQGDFVFITDVAKAIADSVSRGKGNRTYNIGSGYLTPVRDIAKMICREMNVPESYVKDFEKTARGKLLPGPYADLKNIKKETGWKPTTDIKTGIKKTVQAFLKTQS